MGLACDRDLTSSPWGSRYSRSIRRRDPPPAVDLWREREGVEFDKERGRDSRTIERERESTERDKREKKEREREERLGFV